MNHLFYFSMMNFESTKKKIKEESFDLDILDFRTMLSTLENLNKAYPAVLVTVSGIREKFTKDFLFIYILTTLGGKKFLK